jgi:hypothetical protein
MALNLLITTSHTSSHRMLFSLDSLAHTHHLQMGRLSVCFAPSITPSGHSLFTRSYLQHTRLMLYPQPCTSLIDCHPPKHQIPHTTPFQLIHNKPPTCTDLKVFGCLCYPNISAITPHKLSPRSVPRVFLGYPSSHKAYRCFNMVTQKLIISRHVIFDKIVFPSISGTPMAMEWRPT